MLGRLGRDFGPGEVERAVRLCKKHGIVCMCDLLLGGPEETRESLRKAIG